MSKGGFNKNTIVVNNGQHVKYIHVEDLSSYESQGWLKGMPESFRQKMKYVNSHRQNPGKASTEEAETQRRNKISSTMKQNPLAGGKRHGSGRGKKGWYKGIFCDSSWELAYVIYCIDHKIPIKRCEEKRIYEWDGNKHIYIPDFVINNDTIIEIKGYNTKQWQIKQQQNLDVVVLYKKEMKPYLDYVINKYGTNYIDLYEKS